jgi:GNAT superfamily N-acetyltransferase
MKFKGYFPGAVGKITELHATYYNKNWGLDVSFETQVGKELSEFIMEFREDRDGLWTAWISDMFAGAVAIDGQKRGEGPRLRWFIVAPECQNRGIGRILLRQSIEFCRERKYGQVYLWTFKGLDAARHLYEEEGFTLCEEHDAHQWGIELTEQMFKLSLKE